MYGIDQAQGMYGIDQTNGLYKTIAWLLNKVVQAPEHWRDASL